MKGKAVYGVSTPSERVTFIGLQEACLESAPLLTRSLERQEDLCLRNLYLKNQRQVLTKGMGFVGCSLSL
jgi:hypothetical protein